MQENIPRFVGNPRNVTIFGQSGGGSEVAVLMGAPRARSLFCEAIIQSSSSLLKLATREEAKRNTHYFLAELGLDETKLDRLEEFPTEDLLKAMPAAVRAAGSIDNFRPFVDGRLLPWQPFTAPAVRNAAGVPLMIGWCENEQRLTFAATPEIYGQTPPESLARTALALGVSEDEARIAIDVYRSNRPLDVPGDAYAQIYGDHRYRRSVAKASELQILHSGSVVYTYLVDWKTPVCNGTLRSPHTLCIAFAFANVDLATGITGTGADRYQLQDQMSGSWLAFARSGNSNHPDLPIWQRYSIAQRPTLVFGQQTRLESDPLREERLALEAYPPYDPALGESRLRAR